MIATALIGAVLAASINTTPIPLWATEKETGPEPSAYTGRYYNPDDEDYRLCVAHNEGRHQYWGTGSNGHHVGTYQMTRALARGAVWMASKEWADLYGKQTARYMRQQLHNTKPTTWSREVWDQLFWTVLNWEGTRSGEHHWKPANPSCP